MAVKEIISSRPGQRAPTEISNAQAHPVASSDDSEYDPGQRGPAGKILNTLREHGKSEVPKAVGGNH